MPAPSTPASTLVPQQYNLGRVESGGGNNSSEGVLEENQTEQPAPRANEVIAPAPVDVTRSETTSAQTCLMSVSWRQASDACFADEVPMIDASGTREDGRTASEDYAAASVEPAAEVAMLTLLGGWWCARPEQADRRIRRWFRV